MPISSVKQQRDLVALRSLLLGRVHGNKIAIGQNKSTDVATDGFVFGFNVINCLFVTEVIVMEVNMTVGKQKQTKNCRQKFSGDF